MLGYDYLGITEMLGAGEEQCYCPTCHVILYTGGRGTVGVKACQNGDGQKAPYGKMKALIRSEFSLLAPPVAGLFLLENIMSKLTITSFAFNVGSMSRKVRDAADPFHAAYLTADADQRKAMRHDWMLGHLDGQGIKNAERVLSHGKGNGAKPEHIKAIDRASSDFRYMVVRPDAKPAQDAPMKSMRLSRDLRALAQALLDAAGDTTTAIKVLKAVAK